jgi:hypothetical protein
MRNGNCVLPTGTTFLIKALGPILVVWLLFVVKPEAHAVPSYSRQTGLPCASCHFAPPELNAFGRKFKLDGYVFTTKPEVTDEKKDHNAALKLLEAFPLSVVFDTSFTSTKSPVPTTQNGSFQFPQDVSLFLAGAWGSHVGSFAQVTYTAQGNHFSWDNTDLRYANKDHELFGKSLTYGVTFNNNPTVEDLWNSTPAWGFPFTASNVSPTPTAKAIINGALSQDVAGLGGYAMWNEHLYIGGTVYRSQHLNGIPNTGATFPFNIRGFAPYWRVAWETSTKNNNLEIGTYGIHAKTSPNAITGLTDSHTDWALDFQFDRTIPQFKGDVLSFRGTYIRENSSLGATLALTPSGAAQPGHHLNTVQGNVEYHYGTKLSGTVALFNVSGTADLLLYPSANGSPHSNGYILNLSWWPEQNIDLAVQYTGYWRFNGAGTNYDGAGRNAGSNNAVFLLGRFVF